MERPCLSVFEGRVGPVCAMDVLDRMRKCKDEHLEGKFEHAVWLVERALELYRWEYGHGDVCGWLGGGARR